MNDRVEETRESEMYPGHKHAATTRAQTLRQRLARAGEGAALGVATWVLLLTLGFPWLLHIGGFDGVLPCAIAGGAFGWAGWRRVPIGAVATLSVVLLLIAYTPIVTGLSRAFIRSDPLPPHADAVMVLSAGVNDDGTISPASMDQLVTGLELIKRGVAPVLVLSREAYLIDGQIVTSQEDQERIVSLTPDGLSKLIVAGVTHSTHDEALRARNLVRQKGWKRIVVVTSPMHTRRACGTFEKAGVTVSCAPSHTRALAMGKVSSPNDRVKAFQLWLYETAGTIRYRQLGWL